VKAGFGSTARKMRSSGTNLLGAQI